MAKFVLLLVFSLLLLPTVIFAEESNVLLDTRDKAVELKKDAKTNLDMKERTLEKMELNRDELKAQTMELKEDRMDRRGVVKTTLAETRDERKLEVQKKREEFKARLTEIKDEQKQKIVERIDLKLGDVNKKRTEKMTTALNRRTSILSKLTVKVEATQSEGKDATAALAAVASAEAAIQQAQDAVSEQAAKEYVADISDETKLGENVGVVKNQLQQDLQTVHELVKDAKTAVVNVLKELAKIRGNGGETITSPSGSLTPTIPPITTVTSTPSTTPTFTPLPTVSSTP